MHPYLPFEARLALMVFVSIMVFVTAVAYLHRSGITGMDMGTLHMKRAQQS